GALMLLSGLVMFFNTSLVEIFTKLTDYTWGVIFGVGAATVWVSYGVAQKVLLRRLASPQILFLLYTLCTIALIWVKIVVPSCGSLLCGIRGLFVIFIVPDEVAC
ncbi:hypothetical protein AAIH58_34495, partial [Pseudomonas aeruginosa]